MPVSDAIRTAAAVAFGPEHQGAVLEGLAGVPWDDAEWVQGVTLALTFGDRELFDRWVVTAQADAHDIAYVLESPELIDPALTRVEVVRRYQAMGLPVPERLAGDS